jgi:o-succinylbenzoate synthase
MMQINLAVRQYQLAFRKPQPLGATNTHQREGLLVRLQGDGSTGWGECAPLPAFGSESLATASRFLARLQGNTRIAELHAALRAAPPASAFAIACAIHDLQEPTTAMPPPAVVPSAALLRLNAGSAVAASNAGPSSTCIKLKVGRDDARREIAWFHALIDQTPATLRLRLDPNRLWTEADLQAWIPTFAAAAGRIDFVEEPLPSSSFQLRDWLHLASRLPVPIALDEWLSEQPQHLQQAIDADWPGWLVIKPSISGDPTRWFPLPEKLARRCVLSSVYESPVGFGHLQRLCRVLPWHPHGLGTIAAFPQPLPTREELWSAARPLAIP